VAKNDLRPTALMLCGFDRKADSGNTANLMPATCLFRHVGPLGRKCNTVARIGRVAPRHNCVRDLQVVVTVRR